MIHMNTIGVRAADGVATRAFTLGTCSFGAFASVHTAG
jgi:hypothetical protein